MKKLLLVIFCTLIPVLAHGATYYVAKTGSDSRSCANAQLQSTPKLTINSGTGCLSPGDTLIVKAGNYAEQLNNVIPSGTAGNPTTVKANPGDTVIIQPDSHGAEFAAVNISNRQYIVFDGFIVDMTNMWNVGISMNTSSNCITIQNCEVRNMKYDPSSSGGAGIDTVDQNSSNNIIRFNKVHHIGTLTPNTGQGPGAHGIYIHSSNNVIEYNEVYNNVSHGIHLFNTYPGESVNNNIVRNNVIHNNESRGLLLSSGDNNTAYNNIIYGNG